MVEKLLELAAEQLSQEKNIVLEAIKSPESFIGQSNKEIGFRSSGERFVERKVISALDLKDIALIIAKWSEGDITIL